MSDAQILTMIGGLGICVCCWLIGGWKATITGAIMALSVDAYVTGRLDRLAERGIITYPIHIVEAPPNDRH